MHRPNIVEYPNFLTPDECQELINYYESDSDSWQETCFFNTRVMDPLSPYRNSKNSIDIDEKYFRELRLKLQEYGEDALGKELKNLTLSAHKWYPGAYAADHYDNAELDKQPNAWQDNKMVTIIYLNDNYEGGSLRFSEHNLSISPAQGTMVAFDVGVDNLHGVDEVLSGERYTMLASFDWADSVYPEGYLEDLKAGKQAATPEQEKQRAEWKKEQEYYKENK